MPQKAHNGCVFFSTIVHHTHTWGPIAVRYLFKYSGFVVDVFFCMLVCILFYFHCTFCEDGCNLSVVQSCFDKNKAQRNKNKKTNGMKSHSCTTSIGKRITYLHSVPIIHHMRNNNNKKKKTRAPLTVHKICLRVRFNEMHLVFDLIWSILEAGIYLCVIHWILFNWIDKVNWKVWRINDWWDCIKLPLQARDVTALINSNNILFDANLFVWFHSLVFFFVFFSRLKVYWAVQSSRSGIIW